MTLQCVLAEIVGRDGEYYTTESCTASNKAREARITLAGQDGKMYVLEFREKEE